MMWKAKQHEHQQQRQRFFWVGCLLIVVSLMNRYCNRYNISDSGKLFVLSNLILGMIRRQEESDDAINMALKQTIERKEQVKVQNFSSSPSSRKQTRKNLPLKSNKSSLKSSSSSIQASASEEEDYLDKLGILQVKLAVHRNGEASPCGSVSTLSRASLEAAMIQTGFSATDDDDVDMNNKYKVEALLTTVFMNSLHKGECGSRDDNTRASSFAGYCDMGPDRTVLQQDYDQLVRVFGSSTSSTADGNEQEEGTLPCRFYTREGLRVDSMSTLSMIASRAKEQSRSCFVNHLGMEECSGPTLDLYAVPAGRVFMFAPKFVGEKFVIDHVLDGVGEKFVMEVLSLEPRVFELFNFFNMDEADQLIERALTETDELLKLQRSTISGGLRGGGAVISKRTSDNSWDIFSPVAVKMKRRCLEFLGFDEYNEGYSDGLQIARYAETQGYVSHPDYMGVDSRSTYNFDTSTTGGNRFASIVMYLTDLPENGGGETVFPHAFPPGQNNKKWRSKEVVIRELRASGQIDALAPGSWEEDMTALCKTRLVVPPKAGRAIMFYLQHPNGKQDTNALNGACPVLNGTKWDATLWGWSGPRPEYPGAPQVQQKQTTSWW